MAFLTEWDYCIDANFSSCPDASSKLTSLHPPMHWFVWTEQQDEGSEPFSTSYQSVLLVTPQHLNWKKK